MFFFMNEGEVTFYQSPDYFRVYRKKPQLTKEAKIRRKEIKIFAFRSWNSMLS